MEHAVDRLAYATLRQDFDCRNVIFSDKGNSKDGPALVYRMVGHRYDERFVGRLNRSEVYEHILANVMIPSARERYPEGTLFFQQDNHPVHTANRVQRWFTRRLDVDLVDWPPKSPDMNPIEILLATVKRILRSNWAEQPPVRTADEFWDRFLDVWEEVAKNLDLFHNLVDSILRRMRAVVDAGYMNERHRALNFWKEVQNLNPVLPVPEKISSVFTSDELKRFSAIDVPVEEISTYAAMLQFKAQQCKMAVSAIHMDIADVFQEFMNDAIGDDGNCGGNDCNCGGNDGSCGGDDGHYDSDDGNCGGNDVTVVTMMVIVLATMDGNFDGGNVNYDDVTGYSNDVDDGNNRGDYEKSDINDVDFL
ncbi:hypothetical protein ANN_08644 [Periplaneta americana]|uniref:Tc1-like transposase DDE domain-containing protein n=1 Tax=Periplaneta americana TaxID=6978 RepID=A0ABQ8T212_PERAM|nr:hypothetical protein ANN_08644 [Periplaneta americana]